MYAVLLVCSYLYNLSTYSALAYSEVWWRWSGQRLVGETYIELDTEERYPCMLGGITDV